MYRISNIGRPGLHDPNHTRIPDWEKRDSDCAGTSFYFDSLGSDFSLSTRTPVDNRGHCSGRVVDPGRCRPASGSEPDSGSVVGGRGRTTCPVPPRIGRRGRETVHPDRPKSVRTRPTDHLVPSGLLTTDPPGGSPAPRTEPTVAPGEVSCLGRRF